MSKDPRRIHLVVTCTNRKRLPPRSELTIAGAADKLGDEPWKTWKKRLEDVATETLAAEDLYVGQHWYVARQIAAEHRYPADPMASLWICSAGYGLVRPDAPLKSYSAVFTSGSADSVARTMPDRDNRDAVRRWWNGLASWSGPTPGAPRSLVDLAGQDPTSVIILALSPAYLAACRDDIAAAAATLDDPDRFLVVCPSSTSVIRSGPFLIQPLPLDARAVDSLGGTMGTLGARFVRFLLAENTWDELRSSHLRPRLQRWLDALPPRELPVRLQRDDADVAAFIEERISDEPSASATRLLRAFRLSGDACEQRRFHTIYARVKGELDVRE